MSTGAPSGRISLGAGALPPGLSEKDVVVVRTYADAMWILAQQRVQQSPPAAEADVVGGNVNKLDGADHVRRRRALSRAFRRPALAWYKENVTLPAIRRNLEQLLDDAGDSGVVHADLMVLLHRTLIEASGNFLGLHSADEITDAQIDDLVQLYDTLDFAREVRYTNLSDAERARVVELGVEAKCSYAERHYECAHARALERADHDDRPDELDGWDDVISIIAKRLDPAYGEAEDLGLHESIFLLGAAVETTAQTTANVVAELEQWFDAHPEDRALAVDEAFLADAVAETLRLRGHEAPGSADRPPTLAVIRVATEDLTLPSGTTIREGQWIVVNLHDANTDPAVFGDDAHEFNPRRVVVDGVRKYALAFGHGPHYCIGLPMVVGEEGTDGSVAQLVKALYECGLRVDRGNPGRWADHMIKLKWESFPVTFRRSDGSPHAEADVAVVEPRSS